jgi:hypothetical protein
MNERPTDELAAKVVAKWRGVAIEPDEHTARWLRWTAGRDPRDHTDAALELMGWLHSYQSVHASTVDWGKGAKWQVEDLSHERDQNVQDIPISGQPFRYAVVALAAKVLGVEQ